MRRAQSLKTRLIKLKSANNRQSGQRSAFGQQRSAISGRRSAISRQQSANRSAVSRQHSANSDQPSAVSRQRSSVGGQHSAVGGQQSAVSRQPPPSRALIPRKRHLVTGPDGAFPSGEQNHFVLLVGFDTVCDKLNILGCITISDGDDPFAAIGRKNGC